MNYIPHFLHYLLGKKFRITHTLCSQPQYTFRILLLGDSYAYGLGVDAHQTLASHLQAVLNDHHKSPFFEVLNVSRPGLNLIKEWALLQQINDLVEYDLLLLCLSNDDAHPWTEAEIASRSNLSKQSWQKQWHLSGGSLGYVYNILSAISRDLYSINRKFVVAFYQVHYEQAPLVVLQLICEALDIPFLDLVSLFSDFSTEQLCVSTANNHPNSQGHQKAAIKLAEFLQPLLPKTSSITTKQIEYELLERLTVYEKLDKNELFKYALSYHHLIDYSMHASSVEQSTVMAIEGLRQVLNRYYRSFQSYTIVEKRQIELNELNEKLYLLERYILMSELEIDGTQSNEIFLSDSLRSLYSTATSTLIQIDYLSKLIIEYNYGAEIKNPIQQRVEHLIQEVSHLLQKRSLLLKRILNQLNILCQKIINLFKRHQRTIAKGMVEILQLSQEVTKTIKMLILELQESQDDSQDEYCTYLMVDIKIPVLYSVSHFTLVCDYIMLYPDKRSYRQYHYIICDGMSHTYKFSFPEGTFGYVTIELKCIESVEKYPVNVGLDYVNNIALSQDLKCHPYVLGELFYSPLSLALQQIRSS